MVTFGEKRKVIVFNLDHANERELYDFANSIQFDPVMKRYLLMEMQRRAVLPSSDKASIQARLEGLIPRRGEHVE